MRNMDKTIEFNQKAAKDADDRQKPLWDIYLGTGPVGGVAAVAKAAGITNGRASQIVWRGINRGYIPETMKPARGGPSSRLATA